MGHFLGIAGLVQRGPLAQYRAPDVESGPVEAINGAFMLARRSALESIGLLDKSYWMYMEDLDLLFRLKEAGWVTWYEPAALARHVKRGTTAGLRSPRLVWAFHYGMLRFYRTHYAPKRPPAVNWLVCASIVGRAAALGALALIPRPSRLRRKSGATPPACPELAVSEPTQSDAVPSPRHRSTKALPVPKLPSNLPQ
jgi:hypothetical protein